MRFRPLLSRPALARLLLSLSFCLLVSHVVDVSSAAAAPTQLVVATSQMSQLSMSDITLSYQLPVPSVVITSQAAHTSAASLAELTSQQVDFAVDNVGLTAAQSAANPTLAIFPLLATAIVPCYRLDALGSVKLALTVPVLADIFLGAITWWNDSRIVAANPTAHLPNSSITVVLQGSPSGTTLVLTRALSTAWPAFNDTIGVTDDPDWFTMPYASSRTGLGLNTVPSVVLAIDGSIGYAPQANAISAGVNYADMITAQSQRVTATTATVNAAATDLGTRVPSRPTQPVDLTHSAAPNAWPITAMSYAMLDTDYTPAAGCSTRNALVQFLLWYYGAGSTVVSTLLASRQAAPVPPIVLSGMAIVSRVGSTIYCNGSVIPPATQPVVRINSHGAQAVVIGAQLTSAYASISNVTFQAQTQPDVTVLVQMMESTVDLGFMVRPTAQRTAIDALSEDTTDHTHSICTCPLCAANAVYRCRRTSTPPSGPHSSTATTSSSYHCTSSPSHSSTTRNSQRTSPYPPPNPSGSTWPHKCSSSMAVSTTGHIPHYSHSIRGWHHC